MKKRKERDSKLEGVIDENLINLTPLLDVVFVVLIAFILIAPLLEVDNVSLANGSSVQEKNFTEKASLSIYVRADNTVWINGRRIQERELLPTLKELKRKNPKKELKLFHDKKAFFGTYQTVKNAAEIAGFSQMQVVLKPNGL